MGGGGGGGKGVVGWAGAKVGSIFYNRAILVTVTSEYYCQMVICQIGNL